MTSAASTSTSSPGTSRRRSWWPTSSWRSSKPFASWVAGSGEQLRAEWQRFVATAQSLDQFHQELPGFIARLAGVPRTCDPMACPRVLVTGDFFTRFSSFFMRGVASLYADKGIILRPVDLSDLASMSPLTA